MSTAAFRGRTISEPPAPDQVVRTVNDVHSRLNRTAVAAVVRVESVHHLQRTIAGASARGQSVSICGGRHAMGGQQFGAGTMLLDTSTMNRVVDFDQERGVVTVEAGIAWPELVAHLLWASAGLERQWGIAQKQTGADRLSIGGALSANIHGRGLRMRPFIDDVESFDLVNASGGMVRCSREENADLFGLAIGGYGLFGAIAHVTVRLVPRHKVERQVRIMRMDDLPALFADRIANGFEYGDFQFATDPASDEFLQTGVFSCYRPVDPDTRIDPRQQELAGADWRRLLALAHTHKSQAFAEYARYYMATDGQIYWSDTHQLSVYLDDYHEELDRTIAAAAPGSEMISELYIPRAALPLFMAAVRSSARDSAMNVVYGTVRLIEQDNESFLAWAREPWACVVLNLHVDHTPQGLGKAAADFRRLIDIAIAHGGSYYLTYHRWASAEQVERCHPRIRAFLAAKRRVDPAERFTSDWYRHHVRLLDAAGKEQQ